MSQVTMKDIKNLRDKTGAGIMEVKKALEEAKGDEKKAKEILKKQGLAKVAKRADKATGEGQIYSYIHNGGRVGAMVEVRCETDFVARGNDFQSLCKELAMQAVSMNPKDVKDLLKQDYIRDSSKKMGDLVKETAAKVKENITVKQMARMEL